MINNSQKNILVTGGSGYIGCHTVLQLLNNNYKVCVVDNLSNSSKESLNRVQKLANVNASQIKFHQVDILDTTGLENVFEKEGPFYGVIHFAGLKAVGESNEIPLKYYENNIGGTINLLKVMKKYNCTNLIFSSSATVYGTPDICPILETYKVGPCTNPYGKTKLFIENILQDLDKSNQGDQKWKIMVTSGSHRHSGADPEWKESEEL